MADCTRAITHLSEILAVIRLDNEQRLIIPEILTEKMDNIFLRF